MGDTGLDDVQSVYNEGMSQVRRIDLALQKCNYYASTGQLDKWRWMLDTVWRELCFDIEKLEPSTNFDNNSYVLVIKALNKKIYFAKLLHKSALLYSLLDDKEIHLRRLQNLVGKGGKYRDTNEDGMEE